MNCVHEDDIFFGNTLELNDDYKLMVVECTTCDKIGLLWEEVESGDEYEIDEKWGQY